jgi:hypothetical protein
MAPTARPQSTSSFHPEQSCRSHDLDLRDLSGNTCPRDSMRTTCTRDLMGGSCFGCKRGQLIELAEARPQRHRAELCYTATLARLSGILLRAPTLLDSRPTHRFFARKCAPDRCRTFRQNDRTPVRIPAPPPRIAADSLESAARVASVTPLDARSSNPGLSGPITGHGTSGGHPVWVRKSPRELPRLRVKPRSDAAHCARLGETVASSEIRDLGGDWT